MNFREFTKRTLSEILEYSGFFIRDDPKFAGYISKIGEPEKMIPYNGVEVYVPTDGRQVYLNRNNPDISLFNPFKVRDHMAIITDIVQMSVENDLLSILPDEIKIKGVKYVRDEFNGRFFNHDSEVPVELMEYVKLAQIFLPTGVRFEFKTIPLDDNVAPEKVVASGEAVLIANTKQVFMENVEINARLRLCLDAVSKFTISSIDTSEPALEKLFKSIARALKKLDNEYKAAKNELEGMDSIDLVNEEIDTSDEGLDGIDLVDESVQMNDNQQIDEEDSDNEEESQPIIQNDMSSMDDIEFDI